MVIRNYHWLNSASRVLISTCSAPLVQTAERKQFSLFDLDLWPTTLTYNPRLAKVKVDLHCQKSRSKVKRFKQESAHRQTDTFTRTHTDATKRIISASYAVDNNVSGFKSATVVWMAMFWSGEFAVKSPLELQVKSINERARARVCVCWRHAVNDWLIIIIQSMKMMLSWLSRCSELYLASWRQHTTNTSLT